MTPGPSHTITLTLSATGVFPDSTSRMALVECSRRALEHHAIAGGTLDAAGNVLVLRDEHTGVDVHVTATRTSVRHLKESL